MTKRQPSTSDDLGDLLADRDRVEAWLTALDERRASTPPAVYDRVKGDYGTRLAALVAQLRERAGDLEDQVTKLSAKLAAVEAEQRSRADERAESELRHAVGEFTEEKWSEVSATSDVELTRLDARCSELTTEVNRVRELLDSARRSPSDAHAAVGDEPVVTADAVPTPTVVMSAPPVAPPSRSSRPTPVITPAMAPEPVRDAAAAPAPSAASPSNPVALPVRPRSTTPSFDELAFLSSIAADAKEAATPRPSNAGAPARPSRADAAVPDNVGRMTTPTGLSNSMVNVPRASTELRSSDGTSGTTRPAPQVSSRDSAAFLKGVQSDQSKSLKCSECGTMNLPTEWYCEKCGGELSAM